MPNLIKGSMLCYGGVGYVLRTFTHRHTGDHKPDWAKKPMPNGKSYPLQFRDDDDWLENTEFYTTKNGQVDGRYRHCVSHPTWPNNPELRK